MKIKTTEQFFICLAFNIYKIINIVFAVSIVTFVLFYVIGKQLPLIYIYLFWFILGAYAYKIILTIATKFLEKKIKEKNEFYINLLKKRKAV
jgi:hypothetical protein